MSRFFLAVDVAPHRELSLYDRHLPLLSLISGLRSNVSNTKSPLYCSQSEVFVAVNKCQSAVEYYTVINTA
jgi:hypothetical protein